MLDRLSYAAIGFVLGSLLGVLLWYLIGAGWPRLHLPTFGPDLWPWVKYSAVTCAVVGLLFKDRVGTAIGVAIDLVFRAASDTPSDTEWHVPRWLVAVLLAGVVGVVLYLFS